MPRSGQRVLSLASGTLPEFGPVAVVEAAAAAGFDGCGVWYDAASWTSSQTRDVSAAFAASGLVPLEIEVIIVGDEFDAAEVEPLLAAGATIGCTEAIVVTTDTDHQRFTDSFVQLAQLAKQYSINACLEFLPIFAVATLDHALSVLKAAAQPNGKLLLDPIHVARSGATQRQLQAIDPSLISFAQFCDGQAQLPNLAELSAEARWAALRDDAVDGRSCPGEGELNLEGFLAVLPDAVPLSMELRSRNLRERYPDAGERAGVVLNLTRRWLTGA